MGVDGTTMSRGRRVIGLSSDAEIPGWGQVSDLLAKVGSADIQRLDDAVLHPPN